MILQEYLKKIQEEIITTAIVAANALTIIAIGKKLYDEVISKSARQCKNFQGKVKNECMIKIKIKEFSRLENFSQNW